MDEQLNLSTLFVGWKAPSSAWFTVGQLVRNEDAFSFGYTKGVNAAREKGFGNVMGFPDTSKTYEARELFPFFKNRTMPASRPDHTDYLKRLGLSPETATRWDQLVRSGGARSTDDYELFPRPGPREGGGWETLFFLRGSTHTAVEVEREWLVSLEPGEKLYAMRDFQNENDPNALALRYKNRQEQRSALVGYLPRYLSADVATALNDGGSIEINVCQVNPPPAPHIHRVQCRVSVQTGSLQELMQGGEFTPIAR